MKNLLLLILFSTTSFLALQAQITTTLIGSAANNSSVNINAPVAVGETVLIAIGRTFAGGTWTVTDAGGNTYTQDRTAGANGNHVAILSSTLTTALPMGSAVTVSGPGNPPRRMIVLKATGINKNIYPPLSAGGTAVDVPVSLGPLNSAAPFTLVVGAAAGGGLGATGNATTFSCTNGTVIQKVAQGNDNLGLCTATGGPGMYSETLNVGPAPMFGNYLNAAVMVVYGGTALPTCVNTAVLYVDSTATPGGDGLSWATAFQHLQDALQYDCDFDTILVAQGTYYPDTGGMAVSNSRSESFVIPDNVVLLGGYPSGGGGARDFAANTTILSGDIDQTPNSLSNSYHVVRTTGVSATTQMDGFTVTGGNAGGGSADNSGGGMLNENSSLISITNCSFSGNTSTNRGGGMYNISSSPSITNCSFSGNSAFFGGGMYSNNSSPSITNCSFSGNTASDAGGMYNIISSPSITNCSFSGNTANSNGGGMYNTRSSPSITNCSFSGNTANLGGGMYSNNSSPSITNCSFSGNTATNFGGGIRNFDNSSPHIANTIIWNNSASGVTSSTSASIANSSSNPIISYSLIANSGGSGAWNTAIGQDNGDNKDIDPQFITPISPPMLTTAGNLRLRSYSPAINMGSNDSIPPGVTTDLDGEMRIQQSIVDMGAYEQSGIICPSSDTTVACEEPTDTNALGSVQLLVLIVPDSFFMANDSIGFDGISCDNDTIGHITRSFIIADTSNGDLDTICTQRISVIDTAAPVITECAGDTSIVLSAYLQGTLLGQFAATDNCQMISDFTFTDDVQPVGGILQVSRTNIATDICGRADSCEQQITVAGALLNARVLLSGPLGLGNTTETVMWDSLRSKGLIPLTSPYGTGESIGDSAAVLADNGDNSIVDWVLLELRGKDDFTQLRAVRSALVQRDGDVVDTNGMSPVLFDTTGISDSDSFFVLVNHRNHLGAMTGQPQLTDGSQATDFSDVSGDFYSLGFAPQDSLSTPNVFALWPGDANMDSQVAINSDELAVRNTVLNAVENQPNKLLNYVLMRYASEDLNMDGSVIYSGQNNDIDVILDAIYRHPQNVASDPGFIIPEQLPAP